MSANRRGVRLGLSLEGPVSALDLEDGRGCSIRRFRQDGDMR
jgi:hypothetical protein